MERAVQERQQKIVQAEGEARAAYMLGEAIADNPGFLKLRRYFSDKVDATCFVSVMSPHSDYMQCKRVTACYAPHFYAF